MSQSEEQKTTAIAVVDKGGVPAVLSASFIDDAGDGMGNASMDSFARPALSIVQSMSPCVKKSDPAYIKGAEEGMIIKTDTQALFDGEKGVTFVPVHYEQQYIEWRAGREGFVAAYDATDPIVKKIEWSSENKPLLPNGNLLVDTRDHYGLLVGDDGSFEPVIISMSSTAVKASKKWMSAMRSVKMQKNDGTWFHPPTYANVYKLTTVAESNDKGSWYTWKADHVGFVGQPTLYKAAKEFAELIKAGQVRVDRGAEAVTNDGEAVEDAPF